MFLTCITIFSAAGGTRHSFTNICIISHRMTLLCLFNIFSNEKRSLPSQVLTGCAPGLQKFCLQSMGHTAVSTKLNEAEQKISCEILKGGRGCLIQILPQRLFTAPSSSVQYKLLTNFFHLRSIYKTETITPC